jgi:hypothetical protein
VGTIVSLVRNPIAIGLLLAVLAAGCGSTIPSPSPASTTNTAAPTLTQSIAPAAPTTMRVGSVAATCVDVNPSVCADVASLAINNLGRGVPPDVVTVTGRPVCPPVPDWADGSFCWQANFASAATPLCMVVAKRPTLGGYGQVGGPILGRAGPLPKDWPACD